MSDDRRVGTRVHLTLPDQVVEQLDRISAATGAGRARIVREWLVDAAPMLEGVADALELAKSNQDAALRRVGQVMNAVSETSGQLSLDIKATRRRERSKRGRAT